MASDNKIDDIMLRLKIIGQIKKDDKVMLRGGLKRDPPTTFQKFKRWWYSENRLDTVENIYQIIDRAILITFETIGLSINRTLPIILIEDIGIPDLLTEKKIEFLSEMIDCFDSAVTGLVNLRETYSDDGITTAKLDLLIKKIGNYTKEFQLMIDTYPHRQNSN